MAPQVREIETDLLIIGGEDHKTGQADDAQERFKLLEAWGRERWSRPKGRSTRPRIFRPARRPPVLRPATCLARSASADS